MKIKFRVNKIVYQKDFYRIFNCVVIGDKKELHTSKYRTFSLKGEYPFLDVGSEYELELEEKTIHDIYGATCEIALLPELMELDAKNLTREESYNILMTTGATSENIANAILDAYPNFIYTVLNDGIETIDVENIKGVGEYRLGCCARKLLERYKYYGMMKEFEQYEVSIKDCSVLLIRFYDINIIKSNFENNPYMMLINVLGRSFAKTDKVIMKTRADEFRTSVLRCSYLVDSALGVNESLYYNTSARASDLYEFIVSNYDYPELYPIIFEAVTTSEKFHYDEDTKTVSRKSTYEKEVFLSEFIKERIRVSKPLNFNYKKYTKIRDGVLTKEQQDVLKAFCERNIVINNSGAGTGKTATTRALLDMLDKEMMDYILLAPTGKAAKVLSELTGREACTIHKALARCKEDEGLNNSVVVIEEASMISVDLLCMLFSSLTNPNVRLLINLDLAQISPIGYGCPLRDIIDSNILPVNNLTKIFRYNEGGLFQMAAKARNGEFYLQDFKDKDRATLGDNKDYTFIRCDNTKEQIINEYKKLLNKGISSNDITILTPWNVTDFGTISLNNDIQEIVNPNHNENVVERTIRKTNVKFKIGDIILNTVNNYYCMSLESYNILKQNKDIEKQDLKDTVAIMNGECGIILNIDEGNIIAQFDEDIAVFDEEAQENLLLGYALTSYKAQGSSIPYVISLTIPSFRGVYDRNIIYTNLTRTQKECIDIVDLDVLEEKIKTDSIEERMTNLKKLLTNG